MKYAIKPLTAATIVLVVLYLAAAAPAQDKPDPALDKFYTANALYNRSLFKLAAAEYRAFLDKHPKHAKATVARYRLALSLYHMGDLKAAAPLLEELAKEPAIDDQVQLHNLWGVCLLALDKNEEAEKAFAWTVKNAEDATQKQNGQVGLIEAQYRQEKWQQVAKTSDAFLEASPKSPHATRVSFHGAVARYKLKDYDKAAAVFKQLTAAGQGSPFVHHATFLLAECHRQRKQLDAALALYEDAAKKRTGPHSEDASYQLGFIRFAQGKHKEAIRDLSAFLTKYKTSKLAPQASLYLGRAYLEAKTYDKAAGTLALLTEKQPVAAAATLWLARTYSRQKDYAKAQKTISESLSKFAKDALLPELQYELADAQMRQGKFEPAAALFAEVLSAGPETPQAPSAITLRAYCLHKIEQYDDSLKLCRGFVKSHADHESMPDVLFLQGENLLLTGQLDEALRTYQKYLKDYAGDAKIKEKQPRLDKIHLRIGQVHHQQNKWKEALAAIAPLLQAQTPPKDPFFDQLYFLAGDSHFRLKDWDKAIAALQRFITEKPKQPNVDAAMFNLSLAYQHKNQPAKAAEIINKLAETFPDSKHAQKTNVERGRLFYEAKQYDKARAALQKAAANNDPRALYYIGWVALAENKPDEAAGYFSKLVEEHPEHALTADAVLQHSILQVGRKEFAKAQQNLTGLIKAQPKHPKLDQVIFYLGLCMARQEQWAGAIKKFERHVTDYPKSTVRGRALYELAWCQKGAKKPAEAAKRYAEFLKAYPTGPLAQNVAFELAELEYEAEQYDKAIPRLQALLKTAPKELRPKVLYRLGRCHFDKKAMLEAAKNFEAMLAEESKSAMAIMAYCHAGEARLKLKEYETARTHFAAAVAAGQKTPVHERSLLRLGECQALTSKWAESQKTCDAFLELYSKSKLASRARFGLGWAKENQQKYDEAIAEYRKVVAAGRRDQTSARCQFQIGECLLATNKVDDAIKELTLVSVKYGFDDWSAKALLEIGRALQAKGDTKGAIKAYTDVTTDYEKTNSAAVAKKLLEKLQTK